MHTFISPQGNIEVWEEKPKDYFTLEDGEHLLPKQAELTLEEEQERLKAQRDTLLKESDFSQMNDAPLSDEEKEVWKNYRQALRDLPQQELFLTSPKEVQLPAKP